MICLFLWLTLISAIAEHDHTLHIDTKFVHGEAMRSAWLSLDELEKNIVEFSETL